MVNVAFGSLLSTLRASLSTAERALAARTAEVTAAAHREHAFDAATGEHYAADAHVVALLNEDLRCAELSAEISALTGQIERAEDALDASFP